MRPSMDFSDVALTAETRLDADEFVLLWIDDWYDGPLGGMVGRSDELLYLQIHDRGVLGTDAPWRWVVLRLSPAALAEQTQQHALFVHHVGDRWCTHARAHAAVEGERSFDAFYQQQATRPALTRADCEVLGWLVEPPRPELAPATRSA